jgi:prepilin-type N-terminal cleavage/methylation domain-containing protein
MKITPRTGKAAFTLIEVMAVITIIVILAGLVVGGMSFVNERQAKNKAQVQMALISKALEEYKLDMGTYPPTTNKTGSLTTAAGTSTSSILYQALFKDGYDYTLNATPPANWTKATKIYLPDLDPTSTKQGWVTTLTIVGANLPITDPWGNQYCYRTATGTPPASGSAPVNANTQNPDFDLWSMGKDGKSNAANPSLTTPASNNPNVDDIRNF